MSLNKFLGNESTLEFIRHALDKKSLSHSLLVTGEKGIGKKTFARFLAKTLNCDKDNFFKECDCVSCAKIESGNHPDVRWYGLDEEKTSVKLAEIKDLIHWIGLKPFEAKMKVFIINDAHDMTTESQNAMLKTLEEPPPQSQLILLSDHRNLMLETIVSRSVEIKLRPLSSKDVIRALRDDLGVEEEWSFLSQLSGGNLGKAIRYAEEGWLEENRRLLESWLRLGSWDFFSQEGVKSRGDLVEIVELFLHFLRDTLVFKETQDKNKLFFPHELARIKEFADKKKTDEIIDLMNELISTRESLENNLNQKITSAYIATRIEEKFF